MGSLHEANPSLWVGTAPGPGYHELHGDMSADVVVVGAGIAGLTAAVLLKEQGRRVVVIESGRVASGATGYTTAKLSVLHGLIFDDLATSFGDVGAKTYADANLAGVAVAADLAERHGIDCDLERRPAYTYTVDPAMADKVRAEVAAAQRAGLAATFTVDTDLPYSVAGAIRVENQAQFHPRKYCLGLAAAIDGGGSHVLEGTRALSLDEGEPCRVETDHGTITADFVIEATHLPFSDKGGHFARAAPMRSYAMSAHLDGPVPKGMYLSADTPSRSVRSALVDGEEVVLLGGEGHKVGQDPDTRARHAALEDWARLQFPVGSVDTAGRRRTTCPQTTCPSSARSARGRLGPSWPPASRSGG